MSENNKFEFHEHPLFTGIATMKKYDDLWFDSYTILHSIMYKPISSSLKEISAENKKQYELSNYNIGQRFDMINYNGIQELLAIYDFDNKEEFIDFIEEIMRNYEANL